MRLLLRSISTAYCLDENTWIIIALYLFIYLPVVGLMPLGVFRYNILDAELDGHYRFKLHGQTCIAFVLAVYNVHLV